MHTIFYTGTIFVLQHILKVIKYNLINSNFEMVQMRINSIQDMLNSPQSDWRSAAGDGIKISLIDIALIEGTLKVTLQRLDSMHSTEKCQQEINKVIKMLDTYLNPS